MVIQKIFNNNAVTVVNAKGKECVVIGKGIAYGKKPGDSIDATHAVKIYRSAGHGLAEKVSNIVETIPFDHVKVCNEIVGMARQELGEVDDKIFLTLIDHISFAIERHKNGMEFANTLWEIQKLYPREHRVGILALDIIETKLGVRLPPSEATFIAFHFLNANGTSMKAAKNSLKLINGILDIVRRHFSIGFDEDTTHFTRFMTHLRFFAGRINSPPPKPNPSDSNGFLLGLLSEMPAERACVEEISDYIQSAFGHTVSKDEKSYLIIHIRNVVREAQSADN